MIAGISNCGTKLVTSTVDVNHHWQTQIDVRGVNIEVQAIFTVCEIGVEYFRK